MMRKRICTASLFLAGMGLLYAGIKYIDIVLWGIIGVFSAILIEWALRGLWIGCAALCAKLRGEDA